MRYDGTVQRRRCDAKRWSHDLFTLRYINTPLKLSSIFEAALLRRHLPYPQNCGAYKLSRIQPCQGAETEAPEPSKLSE